MEIKKIIIVHKRGLEDLASDLYNKVKSYKYDLEILLFPGNYFNKSLFRDVDLVITLGGDGTFIAAANMIENSYIIGINSQPGRSEGALTSITINEVDKLKNIFQGDFKIIKRNRAKIKLNGVILEEHAVNEVYVGAELNSHTSRYVIKFKDSEEEHRSAGVIISTGTGSKAWYRSVGGEPFAHNENKLGFIVREPYIGKIFCPSVLNGEIFPGEKVIIESKRTYGGVVSVGYNNYPFDMGDVVEIELSDTPLNNVILN